jgi:TPR repeat protein
MPEQMDPETALAACRGQPESARATYQQARALFASGDFSAARNDFERALKEGYGAAGIDLGMLFSRPASGSLDLSRAVTLYEQAWNAGVTIAAFELASLYEHGVKAGDPSTGYVLAPDEARAWSWYEKGAGAGEPQALARTAERFDDTALSEPNDATRREKLLAAFARYAAAAEGAVAEDWPDDAWRGWRYRRATLARVLANEGMMPEVAKAYTNARSERRR